MHGLRPDHVFYRGRWPDADVPTTEPLWLLFEVDHASDAVVRLVDIYQDGTVTRDSIEIEQRQGDHCPSLIDISLADGFRDALLEAITPEEFGRGGTRAKTNLLVSRLIFVDGHNRLKIAAPG